MDLNTIDTVLRPATRADLAGWRPGDAWLAGGTWLFSEPQPDLRRLIDLDRLGWAPLRVTRSGLEIAATCTFAELARFEPPRDWAAAPLFRRCCQALVGSFKVWATATVGGNLCLALPAGPMIALACALDAACVIWTPDGGERRLAVPDFVIGPQETALRPGEILRSIAIPASALVRRTAFRRMSLSPQGRSGALLIGTLRLDGFGLTITASVRRPVRLAFPSVPEAGPLSDAIGSAIPRRDWYDDAHGAPDWRAHVTGLLAQEIRAELAARA